MLKGINAIWAYARAIKRQLERGKEKGQWLVEFAIILGVIVIFSLANLTIGLKAWEFFY